MQGKFNVVTDGAWGSTGKGLICSYLAARDNPAIISSTNMANAGHTAVNIDGKPFIAKALPSGAIVNKWMENGGHSRTHTTIVIGPTAAFHLGQMLKEIDECGLAQGDIVIHPRAGVITEEHRQQENDLKTGTKHIASTMQGCGTFLADKIMRRKELKLARDYPELDRYILKENWSNFLLSHLKKGEQILHEGSQGFSLDINHGSHYPHCTSRGTTATQNLADMGLPVNAMGDVYLVIRPYPIRVGNVVENGEQVGYSGDSYDDHEEITWKYVAEECGAPPEVMKGELTTVTKRLRRVFSFSRQQLREAVIVNGATKIALNFANYIEWDCYQRNDAEVAEMGRIKDFIYDIESITGIPVSLIGTGPQLDNVVDLERNAKRSEACLSWIIQV